MSNVTLLKTRYQDAYKVSKAAIGFGGFFKFIGLFLGILGILANLGLFAYGVTQLRQGFLGYGASEQDRLVALGLVLVGGTFWSLLTWAIFHLLGVLVSAIGQTLSATLDNSINTSTLITDQEKAQVIFASK